MTLLELMVQYEASCKKLYEFHGKDAQLRVMQEECGELVAAVSHYFRERPDAMQNLVEEMCDVLIMIMQCTNITNNNVFCSMFSKKMERCLLRAFPDGPLSSHS